MDNSRSTTGEVKPIAKTDSNVPHVDDHSSVPIGDPSSKSDSLESILLGSSSFKQKETMESTPRSTLPPERSLQTEAQKTFPPQWPEAYLVDFDGANDPLQPQNWPFEKKFASLYPDGTTPKDRE